MVDYKEIIERHSIKRKGLLIVFEGVDGCGKSTQSKMLGKWIEELSIPVHTSFEPTGERYGIELRALWQTGKRHDPSAELDLFRKDRMEHVQNLIGPNLLSKSVIILDRYYYSSIAYQGVRGDKSPEEIYSLMSDFAPTPDVTFLFDLEVDSALDRIRGGRNEVPNIMEKRDNLAAVKSAFDRMNFSEIERIDASQDVDAIFVQLQKVVRPLLEKKNLL
jgi:dTMP kinase